MTTVTSRIDQELTDAAERITRAILRAPSRQALKDAVQRELAQNPDPEFARRISEVERKAGTIVDHVESGRRELKKRGDAPGPRDP